MTKPATAEALIAHLHEAGQISGLTLFHTGRGWHCGVQRTRSDGWNMALGHQPLDTLRDALGAALRVAKTQPMPDDDDDLLGFGPQPEEDEEDLIG